MWPVLLDMTKEESMQSLRNLELEAYSHLVSALRAQGPLDLDKRKLLKDTSQVLNIPQDRHKAEIRRAVNDEKLNTIAYHVTGVNESLDDWAQEGRRAIPVIPRTAPQTAYSAIADEVAENASHNNRQLPHPTNTERKRPIQTPVQNLPETKGVPFRVPEAPKTDDNVKKRKLPFSAESSSLAQHLLGTSKLNRTQQLYRQRTKGAFTKEPMKLKPKMPFTLPSNGPKVAPSSTEETIEQIQNEINSYSVMTTQKNEMPSCSNENQAPRAKVLTTPIKPGMTFKPIVTNTITPKKVSKGMSPLGQKLIVVSNAQTITSNSILQKTLSVPLMKNISVKNLEKFKIVTAPQNNNLFNLLNQKHKVVTVKTNQTKKVIPLSLLNSKGGIKVLPIGGKIVGKTTTTPWQIVNASSGQKIGQVGSAEITKENGKSTVLDDIMKASGVTNEDFDEIVNHEGEVLEQVEAETVIGNCKANDLVTCQILEDDKIENSETVCELNATVGEDAAVGDN